MDECETSAASIADGHPLLDELKGDEKLAYHVPVLKMSDRRSRLTSHLTPILSVSHTSGLLRRLQQSTQPIKDGQDHLVVLCETVETIFRKGLKRRP